MYLLYHHMTFFINSVRKHWFLWQTLFWNNFWNVASYHSISFCSWNHTFKSPLRPCFLSHPSFFTSLLFTFSSGKVCPFTFFKSTWIYKLTKEEKLFFSLLFLFSPDFLNNSWIQTKREVCGSRQGPLIVIFLPSSDQFSLFFSSIVSAFRLAGTSCSITLMQLYIVPPLQFCGLKFSCYPPSSFYNFPHPHQPLLTPTTPKHGNPHKNTHTHHTTHTNSASPTRIHTNLSPQTYRHNTYTCISIYTGKCCPQQRETHIPYIHKNTYTYIIYTYTNPPTHTHWHNTQIYKHSYNHIHTHVHTQVHINLLQHTNSSTNTYKHANKYTQPHVPKHKYKNTDTQTQSHISHTHPYTLLQHTLIHMHIPYIFLPKLT